jgi:hypothetical protein
MCEDKNLERPNYVTGQVLTVDDFTTEQSYFLKRLRRHNRYMHGWGVVSGFTVSVKDEKIMVEPGIAIDCAGNEIFLAVAQVCVMPKDTDKLYIVIQYRECPTDSLPIPGEPCRDEGDRLAPTRIREECQVDISVVDASSNHAGMGPGTPGCGCPHPISIARIVKGRKGWRVILMGRRKSPLPTSPK